MHLLLHCSDKMKKSHFVTNWKEFGLWVDVDSTFPSFFMSTLFHRMNTLQLGKSFFGRIAAICESGAVAKGLILQVAAGLDGLHSPIHVCLPITHSWSHRAGGILYKSTSRNAKRGESMCPTDSALGTITVYRALSIINTTLVFQESKLFIRPGIKVRSHMSHEDIHSARSPYTPH